MRGQGRIALTERGRHLIGLVSSFRFLSRDQLMALAPFRSLTRANTTLASLVRVGLLSRKVLPVYPGKGSAQALYYLGTQSGNATDALSHAPRAQVRQIARWDLRQVEHVLAANQSQLPFAATLNSGRYSLTVRSYPTGGLRGLRVVGASTVLWKSIFTTRVCANGEARSFAILNTPSPGCITIGSASMHSGYAWLRRLPGD
jgi:Replication-relaxation